ncbi:DUF4838 domain-containing protein [Myroides injenensis]|uniref:DUF4838 domain-containing protein n=1 Tax=Myroides injenensis TaxID=1183151 RepID=UPI00226E98C2|nr:DUF4838 domain-containing protein [Myroides injenensis]
MLLFKYFRNSLLLFSLVLLGCGTKELPKLKAHEYIISGANEKGELWAEYTYNHLVKRSNDQSIFSLNGIAQDNQKEIQFEIDEQLSHDYCISHGARRLLIQVRSDDIALWLVYQLIEALSREDNRINSQDLNPAVIEFYDHCSLFDFKYRDPHYRPNLQEDYAAINANANLEEKWGIWGHNLKKVLTNQNDNMYALINGKRDSRQWCFSSKELLGDVTSYINDNYGDSTSAFYYFMIMPQDNNLVCQCHQCLLAGNTDKSASSAVVNFINELAARFKGHHFFTSDYRTTSTIPTAAMASNSGVILSTIELPKGIALDEKQPATKQFIEEFYSWAQKTSEIYIWDYSANFDDYLTPIPTLYNLQEQLKFYKKLGVKGIFLNASGYDYMPFDDVKTYVAGQLMKNGEIGIDKLVEQYFKKFYPTSHSLLTSYYLSLEKQYQKKAKQYDMYSGFTDILKLYCNPIQFVEFYEALEKAIIQANGQEQVQLKKLYTALTFTRLQLAYYEKTKQYGYAIEHPFSLEAKPIVNKWIDELEHSGNYAISNYRETNGPLDKYIAFWREIYQNYDGENLLKGKPIEILSKKDEGFEKSDLLNDAQIGYEQDYHIGWYISSLDDLHLRFSTLSLEGIHRVAIRFLQQEQHHFYLPKRVEFWVEGKMIAQVMNQDFTREENVSTSSVLIDLSQVEYLDIKVIRQQREHRNILACDEIQLRKI